MKKIVLAVFVAVSAAILWVSAANAANGFCAHHPQHPSCHGRPPDRPHPPHPHPRPHLPPLPHPPPPPHRHPGPQPEIMFNFSVGPSYGYRVYSSRCVRFGQNLRRHGFYHVHAVSCGRRYYTYVGYSDGERLRIIVSGYNGRIIDVQPAY